MNTQTKITLCSIAFLLIVATLFFRSTVNSEGFTTAIAPPSAITFNYQGQLLDSSGNAIDEPIPMTFSLYDVAIGGTACWTESHTGTNVVTVTDGIFTVLLGSITDIPDECITGDTYLDITVDSEPLTPRELLGSVDHAVEAMGIMADLNMSGKQIHQIGVEDVGYLSGGANPSGYNTFSLSANAHRASTGEAGDAWIIPDSTSKSTTIEMHDEGSIGFFVTQTEGENNFVKILDLSESGAIVGRIESKTGNGGIIEARNPDDDSGVSLSWYNDVARIRVGGDGAGANNGLDIQGVGNRSLMRITSNGNVSTEGDLIAKSLSLSGTIEGSDIIVGNVRGHGASDTRAQIHMPGSSQEGNMFINWHTGRGLYFGGGTESTKFHVDANGNGSFAGDLSVGGSCSASAGTHSIASNDARCTGGSITTGAVIEANLQTPEQMRSESIDQFEKGDLLCWDVEIEELALCDTANSPLIIAVANAHGKPIVMGAEPIKVTGDVKAGDFLVASDVPGRAMATDNPTFGIVIGQALQSSTSNNALVLAMIGNK